jgi:RNA-directed DNA polymerase
MSTTENELQPDPLGRNGLPRKVSRLRWKLIEKAKQEPGFRFYALYDRIYRTDVLEAAYRLVRKTQTSPGVDGRTFADLEASEDGVAQFLQELHEDLRTKRYKPDAVRRVLIPKPDGRMRPLGIPTIRDRVAQMATLLIVEPIFEADFTDCSYGFRPGRCAEDALVKIREHLNSGRREVYDADLKGYFDTIPHDKLMAALAKRISDRSVLSLFRMWLQSPIEEEDDKGRKTRRRPQAGTPQGGVISPLLANIYLHWFEILFHRANGPAHWSGARLVRYADDFVVLARRQTDRLRAWIETTIEGRFALTINPEKTKTIRITPSSKETLDFLGFTFRYERSRFGPGRPYLRLEPSAKSKRRFRDRIRELTSPMQCFKPARTVVDEVNRYTGGWIQYFGHSHCGRCTQSLNHFVYERLTRHLRRRSQRGHRPPKDRSLYDHMTNKLGVKWLRRLPPPASASLQKYLW